MQKITPFLWFDRQGGEAAKFYTSIFPKSEIKNSTALHNTPSGRVEVVTIELSGQEFTLLFADPLFKFTPAVSFLVGCETKEEVDALWGNYLRAARHSWSLADIPSAKDMDG